jgi:type 1 fimbria pilin
MKKRLTMLLLAATLASGVGMLAQAPPASTTLSVRGTIDNYDVSSRTLSLSTSSGTVKFPVSSATRISQAGHKVEAAELQKLVGDRATVRYTDSGGNRVVESVHVFGK